MCKQTAATVSYDLAPSLTSVLLEWTKVDRLHSNFSSRHISSCSIGRLQASANASSTKRAMMMRRATKMCMGRVPPQLAAEESLTLASLQVLMPSFTR